MQHLRWIAVPLFAVGLVFLFFGLVWTAGVQLTAAAALIAVAASVWRITSGGWPLDKNQ